MAVIDTGAIVFGRPIVDGVTLSNPQRAVVLTDDAGSLTVWFPGLGDPGLGQSVQELARDAIEGQTWPVGSSPRTWLTTTYRAARRSKLNGLVVAEWEPGLSVVEHEIRRRRGHLDTGDDPPTENGQNSGG